VNIEPLASKTVTFVALYVGSNAMVIWVQTTIEQQLETQLTGILLQTDQIGGAPWW
jgi:hypothetical protein